MPLTPPSPLPLRIDPDLIPQSPPRVERTKTKKTYSPITYIFQSETSRIPASNRLGDRPATPNTNDQEETPRRSVHDRLGERPTTRRPVKERLEKEHPRRSQRNAQVEPFRQGCAPRRDSEFDRKTWEEGPGGYHYPVQDEEEDSDEPSDQGQ